MSDRIAVMNKGRYEQLGDPETLYERPDDPVRGRLPRRQQPPGGDAEGTEGDVRRHPARATARSSGRRPPRSTAGPTVDVGVRPEKIRLHQAGEPTPAGPQPPRRHRARRLVHRREHAVHRGDPGRAPGSRSTSRTSSARRRPSSGRAATRSTSPGRPTTPSSSRRPGLRPATPSDTDRPRTAGASWRSTRWIATTLDGRPRSPGAGCSAGGAAGRRRRLPRGVRHQGDGRAPARSAPPGERRRRGRRPRPAPAAERRAERRVGGRRPRPRRPRSSTGRTGRTTWTSTRTTRPSTRPLDEFTAKYGTKVNYSEVVNDNEEFFGTIQPALQGGADTGWDIVTLTDWMAAKLIRLGWVEQFDLANMPNFTANLVDIYKGVDWDPTGDHHAPWQSGMTGLGFDPAKTGDLTSLAAFFTPDPRWKGKVDFLSEMRDAIGLDDAQARPRPRQARPARPATRPCAEMQKATRRQDHPRLQGQRLRRGPQVGQRRPRHGLVGRHGPGPGREAGHEVHHRRRGRHALDRQQPDPEGRRRTRARPSC